MKIIHYALRHSRTVIVSVLAILFFSFLAIRSVRIDIFPRLGLPTVYVAQPYGGLSPEQMEGFITSYYEYHFLYINGVKSVDSKSVQGASLIKIEFNEGTDMSQAMAEVVGYVNRSRAFMPPGTVPPFITRFDAGSVPVGQLVFSSDNRSLSEISDLALFRVRPMFSTLPGVSAPPPFGGNQKTVVVNLDPSRMEGYGLSPDEVAAALARSNSILPAGNVSIGDTTYITPQNSVMEDIQEMQNVPLRTGAGPSIYLRDVSTISLGADITTSYALINGKRSVYIPVTKRADASTWDVVQRVKHALPDMQAAVPEDIHVSYAFDQSGYVINSLYSVLFEGGLGALLTGLVVLLFLGDARSALIVILTIPLSLLASMTMLQLLGQTVNIMTLGGLALSVGILVDEATVTVENIHRHLADGTPRKKAILDACLEIAWPKLLILLCILSVFAPAFFMKGVPGALFLPLALAVGFSMIFSFLLSQTLVPVMANALVHPKKHGGHDAGALKRFRESYLSLLNRLLARPVAVSASLLTIFLVMAALLFNVTGTQLFPDTDSGQFQVRLRMPAGTRFERTEDATRRILGIIDSLAGNGNLELSSSFIGTQPSSYPVNLIHLWTSGPQESVTRCKLRKGIRSEPLKERIRAAVKIALPNARISFEPGDIVEQVMNLGSTNPIEIAVVNKNLEAGTNTAKTLMEKLSGIEALRDLQIATPLNYPAIKINVDRMRSGQLGLTSDQVFRSTVAATSSSRFLIPNYWLDRSSGTAYQVQVQYPRHQMNSTDRIESIPVTSGNNERHTLREVTQWRSINIPGEYDRLNQQRYVTITANIQGNDRGTVDKKIKDIIRDLGPTPGGGRILLRGQTVILEQTQDDLRSGLIVAIVVIFLTMTVFFQSFRSALSALSVLPAVLAGSMLAIKITGATLNIQSYLGMIMAVGVSIANAVLFVTRAEALRREGMPTPQATAAHERLRPILMTSLAMTAGMLPMALGLTEGGDQTAPLGIAVIGGSTLSLFAVLLILPLAHRAITGKKPLTSRSLHPDDADRKDSNDN